MSFEYIKKKNSSTIIKKRYINTSSKNKVFGIYNINDDNFDKKNGKWGGLNVDHAANAFFSLHKQHPSAWTHEIELRPWVENW